jgi:NADH-quinone oxidoreductase subunit J
MITQAVFYFFGGLAVFCSVLVITQRNAMRSVLYLAFTVLSIAGVFFTLQAEYLGAIQVLVYGGGIVVLYIFVIIIVNLKEMMPERRKLVPRIFIFALPALLLVQVLLILFRNRTMPPAGAEPGYGFPAFAEMLLTTYFIPFEIASVLLLAVLVGAIVIARRTLLHDSR